jgi:hypothetical protein
VFAKVSISPNAGGLLRAVLDDIGRVLAEELLDALVKRLGYLLAEGVGLAWMRRLAVAADRRQVTVPHGLGPRSQRSPEARSR